MKPFIITLLILGASWPAQASRNSDLAKPSESLIVPIAGNIHGARRTWFKTDLTVRNSALVTQSVIVTFYPADSDNSSGDGVSSGLIQLSARQTVTYEDVVGGYFGRTGIGSIVIQGSYPVMASYRIYTGMTSASADAMPLSDASDVSEERIIGLIHDASFRTNIGIVNLDPMESRTFRISVVGNRDTTIEVTVPPMSVHQEPLPRRSLGHITVSVAIVGPPARYWTAYGTSVDNVTGDSWLQMIARSGIAAHDRPAVSLIVPAVGDKTDVDLTNRGDSALRVALALYALDQPFFYGDPAFESVVDVPPRSTVTLGDPSLSFGAAGALFINPAYSNERGQDPYADLEATYRTWTSAGEHGGSMSRSAAALDVATLPSGDQARVIIGVKLDPDYRCNLGIYAHTYDKRKFHVTATSERGSVTMDVEAGGFALKQFELPAANLGYVTLTITPLDGSSDDLWTAYATSVDRRSGDSWIENAYTD